MKESIKTRVLRGSSGDEDISALEQEVLIDGSSDFSPNLTANALESTLNHLSKWFVTALFGTIILWRHDAEALWAALGSILNAGLSTILKQILNQERPVSTLRPISISDPGMPSSHAQSFFYAVAFAILSMVECFGLNGLTITLIALLVAVGSYFSWLRVAQEFHTVTQVAVGAVLGSIFSILWFWSWGAIVLKAFISYLWVRIFVVGVSLGLCLGFVLYVIRYWVIGAR